VKIARFNVYRPVKYRADDRIGFRLSAGGMAALVASLPSFPPARVVDAEPARFKIKKDTAYRRPWILTDRRRPAFRGGYASLELALRSMDNRVRDELGAPSRLPITSAEILERMSA